MSAPRTTLRVWAPAQSQDAQLIEYLQSGSTIGTKETVFRALRAFYLPKALEGKIDPVALQRSVDASITELHYCAFQLQLRFGGVNSDRAPIYSSLVLMPPGEVNTPKVEPIPTASSNSLQLGLEDVNFSQVLDDF